MSVRPGTRFDLLTRVTDAHGALHDLTVPLVVRTVHHGDGGAARLGCAVDAIDDDARRALVEFCDVVMPLRRIDTEDWRGDALAALLRPIARRATAPPGATEPDFFEPVGA